MNKAVKAKSLNEFEGYLRLEKRMEITIKKYVYDAKVFVDFLGNAKITEETLSGYREYLLKKYAPASAKSMIIAVNKYLEYCGTLLRINHTDLNGKSLNMKNRELSMQEYSRLISAAKAQNDERLLMALETICSAGLQFSQLRYITVEAVENSYAVVESHGKKSKVYLSTALCEKLKNYCRKKDIDQGMIFVTRSGNPIDRSNLARQMRKLCNEANVNENKIFLQNLKTLYTRTYEDLSPKVINMMGLAESEKF